MKKNTLFLSGRQEGKTTFGLYSLYRYIMDTDEKTSVFYVAPSMASLKTARDKLIKMLHNLYAEFTTSSREIIIKKTGVTSRIRFITPRVEELCGTVIDYAVLDDVDCWCGDVVGFINTMKICMCQKNDSQIIAFINDPLKVRVNPDERGIELLNNKGEVKLSFSHRLWDVRTYFERLNEKPINKTLLANIWDAGDSLITQIELNKDKELELFDEARNLVFSLYTNRFTRYFFVEKVLREFIKHVAGNCGDMLIQDQTLTRYKVLYGVNEDGQALEITSFNEHDVIQLRIANKYTEQV